MAREWLADAAFYQIYPQSFYDANGDGIGDIPGITEKLDYVAELGCNALWICPCFDSPFKDAGYDVRDYRRVAPRYGTNDDLVHLMDEAHARGMRVLLDLVPGHTSEEHPWFRESARAEANELSGRYIWTDSAFVGTPQRPSIAGECERDGCYMVNFFKCQPALNYGWSDPSEPWMSALDAPEALATREALKDVMRFWLDRGADGFRVDMADFLVKDDDEERVGNTAIWQDVRRMLDEEYPECVLVSEASRPWWAIPAGFDVDFYLDHPGNGYNTLLRDGGGQGEDHSFFRCGAGGDARRFLDDYLPRLEAVRGKGYVALVTCNHDTPRATRTLGQRELALAWATLLTLPGPPFVYYGDEIGMRYLDLPTKEGGYARTGSRSPMQWGPGANLGFSTAPAEELYLPVDDAADAPTVEAARADAGSLWHVVHDVLALRHRTPELQADGPFELAAVREDGSAFAYRRGALTLAVNPSPTPWELAVEGEAAPAYLIGEATASETGLVLGPQSFVICQGPPHPPV